MGEGIQRAATFCEREVKSPATGEQEKYVINVIDTPGASVATFLQLQLFELTLVRLYTDRVDFIIEVERALHVSDGSFGVMGGIWCLGVFFWNGPRVHSVTGLSW